VRKNTRMSPQTDGIESLAVGIQRAAQMLDVSPRTIENYLRAKILPARKIGRRTIIPIDALKAFLRCDQTSPLRIAQTIGERKG
jgi:excisionase family DNA binding protein